MTFPHWYFHLTEPARIVNDPTELEALGPGWVSHPDKLKGGGVITGEAHITIDPVVIKEPVKKGKRHGIRG
jgi:hypothetical protein